MMINSKYHSQRKDGIIIQAPVPWFQQIQYRFKIWMAKIFANVFLYVKARQLKMPQPDVIKSYPSQSHLRNRIFYPPKYQPGDTPPLFLDIHGGGFILFNPRIDDMVNAELATRIGCIVISLDYSKSPAVKFPIPTNELIRTISDILQDESLSYDRSRVVLGGHSAGGNLTVSVAQSPELRDRLAGVVSWYPVTDFSDDPVQKSSLRGPEFTHEIDPLMEQIPMILYGYIKPEQDLKDPNLSVVYTDRALLPKHVMIIGAENDMLCHEAWRMARRLTHQDDTVDWTLNVETRYAFEDDHVRWKLIKNAKHGYTHDTGAKGQMEEQRKHQAAISFAEVEKFLLEGPFKVA